MIGITDFRIIPDTSDEHLPPGVSPAQTVCSIALRKAENVSLSCGFDDIIIAADTLVFLDGCPLGKPEDREDAKRMLSKLSGKQHTVYTGLAIMRGNIKVSGAEATDVFFREILADEISAYVSTGEPMDKAGSYGAQGRGAVFIERIEGDYFNVVGLPLCRLSIMLRSFGVNI